MPMFISPQPALRLPRSSWRYEACSWCGASLLTAAATAPTCPACATEREAALDDVCDLLTTGIE